MTNLHSEFNSSFDFYQSKQMGSYVGLVAHNYRFQIEHLSQLRDSSWSPKILDIGAGLGDGLLLLRQQWPGSQCFTVDLAVASAMGAERQGPIPVLASAEGCALPFRDRSIDVIVMNEIIEHLVDTDSILDEVRRILVSDGVLLMSTPNLAAWFNRLALLAGFQPAFSEVSMRKVYGRPGSDLVGHLRLFTSRAFTEMLRDKGFKLTKIGGAPFGSLQTFLVEYEVFVGWWLTATFVFFSLSIEKNPSSRVICLLGLVGVNTVRSTDTYRSSIQFPSMELKVAEKSHSLHNQSHQRSLFSRSS